MKYEWRMNGRLIVVQKVFKDGTKRFVKSFKSINQAQLFVSAMNATIESEVI